VDAALVSVGDVSVGEGDGWACYHYLQATLSKPVDHPVSVTYLVKPLGSGPGYATAGSDFKYQGRSLRFRAGATQAYLSICVRDDNTEEQDEKFQIVLSDPESAQIGDGQAVVTIEDDD